MFFCALSMTASRSLSFCRFSVVDGVLQLALALGQQPDHGLEPRGGIGVLAVQLSEMLVLHRGRPVRLPHQQGNCGNRDNRQKQGRADDQRQTLGHPARLPQVPNRNRHMSKSTYPIRAVNEK
jgi:hypothetical protein